ncbi:tetratricopeptide repeat protein [Phormidesmis sp. 146-33]
METSLLDQGIQQARQGDYSSAIATFSQAITLTPHLTEAYYRRGLAHFELGNIHAAVFDYTAALNQDGDRSEFYYARALGRLELRNFSGALEDVQAAIRRSPKDADAHQLKGTIEQKLMMRPAAIGSFKTAAHLYLSAKDSDSCRRCLQKIEQLQPSPPPSEPEPPIEMPSHAQLLANILKRAENGNCAQALQDLDWALRADPQDATVYCCRAIVKSKMGDKQGAIADLNQALKLNPQDAIALRNRGKLRLQIGDFLGAKADLNQALQMNPQDAMSYVGRGQIESAMGNYQDALIDFSHAIKLQPEYPEAYLGRAQAYAHQEDMQQAIHDRQIAASQFCARQDWKNYNKTISLLNSFQPAIASDSSTSANFAFLQDYEPQLATLASLAEKYLSDDPVTGLMKLRQFGELLAQSVAKKVALPPVLEESQLDLLNRLFDTGYLPEEIHRKLQDIRRIGNQAAHDYKGESHVALKHLKSAWELSIWFCREFGDDSFSAPTSFTPPGQR